MNEAKNIIVIVFLNLPSLAGATTYYVAKIGDDTRSCSQATSQNTPRLTIGAGANCLAPGDKLYVKGGIYNESFTNAIPGGTASAPVTVAAYPGESVTIRPNAGADRVFTFASSASAYIVIDGFVLDATNVSYDVVKITYGSSAGYAHHITIQNCELKNGRYQGILATEGSDSNKFIGLMVHHNGITYNHDHGFYISSNYNLIEHCDIYSNFTYGIQVYNEPTRSASNNTIRYNKIHGNGVGGIGAGIILSIGSNNLAYNNLVWGNTGGAGNIGGIQVDYSASNSKVYHNTVYNNGGPCVYVGATSSSSEVKNNICWQNSSSVVNNGILTSVGSNLGLDPKFQNASGLDFHLQSTSPAINAGVSLSEVVSDFDGVARPQGSAFDIGAYEFVSSTQGTRPRAPTNFRVQ